MFYKTDCLCNFINERRSNDEKDQLLVFNCYTFVSDGMLAHSCGESSLDC